MVVTIYYMMDELTEMASVYKGVGYTDTNRGITGRLKEISLYIVREQGFEVT
jgi:hypothetical protein